MHLSVHRGSEFLKKLRSKPNPFPPPFLASFPGSLLKTWGRREPGNIHEKGCQLPAPDSGGTNDCIMKLHVMFCPLSKHCQILTKPRRFKKNHFWMCGRGTSPRSKFTVVGLRYWLAQHTLQLLVYMYNVHQRTQLSCMCFKEIVNNLRCYQV